MTICYFTASGNCLYLSIGEKIPDAFRTGFEYKKDLEVKNE